MCSECKGNGHLASQCRNQQVITLGNIGEHEPKEEEAMVPVAPLETVPDEECGVQGELLIAINSTTPLEDSDGGEEHAVQGELLVEINSTTPLEDSDGGEEHAVQGELLVAINSTTPWEVLDEKDEEGHDVLEVFVARSALNVQNDEDVCFNAEIKEEKEASEQQFEHLEDYDFIGIEQILSMSCSKNIITSYLRSYWIRIQLASFALRMSKKRSKALKYSKYLFGWSGQRQYLCNKDPLDLRTNPFQEWGNDVIMASTRAWRGDPIQVPVDPVAKWHSKAFQIVLHGLEPSKHGETH